MGVKITIGLPTNRGLKPKCLLSLMEMVSHTEKDIDIVISTKGYNTAENRNYIVAQAIKNGSTHLLCTDDDMIYPKESLDRLLAHDKDIVGGVYNVRSLPKEGVQREVILYKEGIKSEDSIFKCDALGTGFLLIKTDVFREVKQPHFWYKIFDNGMVEMSVDWWFCEKAREKGYEVWCDPTIKIGHIGEYEYV